MGLVPQPLQVLRCDIAFCFVVHLRLALGREGGAACARAESERFRFGRMDMDCLLTECSAQTLCLPKLRSVLASAPSAGGVALAVVETGNSGLNECAAGDYEESTLLITSDPLPLKLTCTSTLS